MGISTQVEIVLKEFEGLSFDEEKNILWGSLYLSPQDVYEIIIDLTPFPLSFPHVSEVGERIPCKLDRHKYNNSDKCCLTTKAKAQILLKTEVKTLKDFMTKIVIPYFENNSYYELEKEYLFGEFSHGIIGIIEGYEEILGIKDIRTIIDLLRLRIRNKKIRPNDECYCNSGTKIKKCLNGEHLERYRQFKLISSDVLSEDIKYFEREMRRYTNSN